MRLLGFPISSVCISGKEWVPRYRGKHGAFEIHRKGTSIFARLVGITQKPDPNDMEVDGGDPDIDYPPTFNLQNEVVKFTHSDAEDTPWYLFLDVVISRSSRDVQRFRTGPGTTKLSCMVGTISASKAQKRKAVVFVGACLALSASVSLKKGLAKDIYNKALEAPRKTTTPLLFEVPPPIGPTEFFRLASDQIDLKQGSAIQSPMMDLALRSLLARTGPYSTTVMIHRYIENSVPEYLPSASRSVYNTPQHYNFIPIGTANVWALLVVIQHRESEKTGGGFDNEAFLITTQPGLDATERGIANGILENYPLPFPFPTQVRRCTFHPTIVAMPRQTQCEAWRSGDRIINYFVQILQSAALFPEIFRSPTDGCEQLRTWDEPAIDLVRPMIATAIMCHLR